MMRNNNKIYYKRFYNAYGLEYYRNRQINKQMKYQIDCYLKFIEEK